MVTIRDVAKHAGVSAGTVSNVLNRPGYVRPETRDKVLATIAELGFTPSSGARQYRPGRVFTVGISVPNLGNPYFVDLVYHTEQYAHSKQMGVVVCNNEANAPREEQNLDLLMQLRVQGIIVAPVNESNPHIAALAQKGVPMVFVDRVSVGPEKWSVHIDDFAGGRMAMQHLIDQGHRSITFVGDPGSSPNTQARLAGARSAIEQSNGSVKFGYLPCGSWNIESGAEAGEQIAVMPAADRPSAVFCLNDMIALGVMQQLAWAGIDVPGEVAVMGYDDVEVAKAFPILLSTVRQPLPELGRQAVAMLVNQIQANSAEQKPEQVVLKPELVVRQSA